MDSRQSWWDGFWKSAFGFILGTTLGFILGIILGMFIVSTVAEGLVFASQVISAVVWPALFLALVVMFRDRILELLNRDIVVEMKSVTLQLKRVLKVDRLTEEAMPKPDAAPPTPALSARQRIRDQWQLIHNKLAEVYVSRLNKPAAPRYNKIRTELQQHEILADKEVGELVDTMRRIFRQTRRMPESQVTADLADYYERRVPRVLERIDEATKRTGNSGSGRDL